LGDVNLDDDTLVANDDNILGDIGNNLGDVNDYYHIMCDVRNDDHILVMLIIMISWVMLKMMVRFILLRISWLMVILSLTANCEV